VDANGILNVSAVEKSTGKTNKITITNDKGRLSKEQIDKMIASAAEHEAEDKANMAKVEAKNELEGYLYNCRNSFREDKVKEKLGEEAGQGERLAEEGIQWLGEHQDASAEEYKEKHKEYEGKMNPLMMKLYAGAPGSDGVPGAMPRTEEAPGPKVEEVD
jgi:L1 cell adhesion molecule like protein